MAVSPRSNTDEMLDAMYPLVTAFANFRTGPGHDYEAMVQEVMLQFFPEAAAGVLDCLDSRPIEDIPRLELLPRYQDRCLIHCCRKVSNRVRASVRRSQRRKTRSSPGDEIQIHSTNGMVPPPKGPIIEAELNEFRALVWQQVQQLNDDDQEAIIIYYFFDQTHQRAAAILGLTVDQFRYRVARALVRLKEALQPLVEDDRARIKKAQES